MAEEELENARREAIRAADSEKRLANDLSKQHKIAKDSLRALENLSSKYDNEKRELIKRLDLEKDEMLRREQHRQEVKITSLKAINEQLNERLNSVGEE